MPTAIITGATGAIGQAIVKQMAQKNYQVICVARNENKAASITEQIRHSTGHDQINYLLADVSRKDSISDLLSKIDQPVDVLINNAAVTPKHRKETPEGIELQWATNVLGYYWMIKMITPLLIKASQPRIVNVSSYWAGGLDLRDPEFKKRPYNNDMAYRQTKQADRMLSYAFAQSLKDKNIAVNACHPGDVNSKLSNNLGYGGHESPDQGAATPVWLATEPAGIENTGKYFEHLRKTNCHYCQDQQELTALMELCASY